MALAFPGCHRRGGVERIMFECAHYLAARDYDVTVFAHEWDEENAPSDTQNAVEQSLSNQSTNDHLQKAKPEFRYEFVAARQRPNFLYGRSFFQECSRRLNPKDFDAIGTFGCVAPLGGVPWVQSVHAAWLERSREFRAPLSWARWRQKLNPLHPVLLQLEKLHFSGRDAHGQPNYRKVIALTPEVQSDLQRIYGVPEKDIVVIPNGFAPHEFNVERADELRAPMRAELGYTDDDRVLVFVANEAERKGLEPLLQAMKIIGDPHLKLLAVGRLPETTWQPVAEKMGLGNQVRFTGPSSDVGKYYAAADAFVLPTQYEPWGLVIVEALACGLPVITSRCAGAAAAVLENQTGFLLDDPASAEEIAGRLSTLPGSELSSGKEKMRRAIADSVQEYAWPRVLQRYEKVLLSSMLP